MMPPAGHYESAQQQHLHAGGEDGVASLDGELAMVGRSRSGGMPGLIVCAVVAVKTGRWGRKTCRPRKRGERGYFSAKIAASLWLQKN